MDYCIWYCHYTFDKSGSDLDIKISNNQTGFHLNPNLNSGILKQLSISSTTHLK